MPEEKPQRVIETEDGYQFDEKAKEWFDEALEPYTRQPEGNKRIVPRCTETCGGLLFDNEDLCQTQCQFADGHDPPHRFICPVHGDSGVEAGTDQGNIWRSHMEEIAAQMNSMEKHENTKGAPKKT